MRSLIKRIKDIENANGFKSENQRQEFLKYARLIDKKIKPEQIKSEQDYFNLIRSYFLPLP